MKLKDWLRANNITVNDFAETLGVNPVSVSRYNSGQFIPHVSVMQKIIEETNGQVGFDDFKIVDNNRRKKGKSPSRATKQRKEKKQPQHQSERDFVSIFFDHDQWEYEPRYFNLSNGERYYPDFFDIKRNVFIEVAASRQAYHANKHKYVLFRDEYPKITFEIRKSTGDLLEKSGPWQ